MVILWSSGLMVWGKEHGSSTKVQNTESDSAKHNHLYFHYTFVCTSHIKVLRSVFASFVRVTDAWVYFSSSTV